MESCGKFSFLLTKAINEGFFFLHPGRKLNMVQVWEGIFAVVRVFKCFNQTYTFNIIYHNFLIDVG